MAAKDRIYIAIDLKSFYASVECVERGLDPLTANLVVADPDRTEKTICLAVSPSLKAYGISGRARLFEVVQRVGEINAARLCKAPGGRFSGESCVDTRVRANPGLKLSYITATPQLAHYIDVSSKIHRIYLKYVAPEDMVVYSIDEVFIDVTGYLKIYGLSAHDLAMKIVMDVFKETGITATAGIGSNLYLCKIAMDIMAKHIPADENGVRIAELDEMSYRRQLWGHRPITDFWRVGRGYSKRLEQIGLYTMGDIARFSLTDFGEDKLYKLFGVNAELLIDHAWGYEPCTMKDIKAYKPQNNSISSGQVLKTPYDHESTRLIVREMTELLVLDLVDKGLVTDQIVLTIGYDVENLQDPERRAAYKGEVIKDHYGREIPKHAHGTASLGRYTSSTKLIMNAVMDLFDGIADEALLSRRITVSAERVVKEEDAAAKEEFRQLDIFTVLADSADKEREEKELAKERRMQEAELAIKKKYGKNAILKGTNFMEGATTIERNRQIGGHRA